MGLFDFLRRDNNEEPTKARQLKVSQFPNFMLESASQDKFSIPRLSVPESQSRLYQKLTWVSNAVTRVANSAAGVDLMVKSVVREEKEDIISHAFEQLLYNPNPRRGRFEFFQASFLYYQLTGNTYWWLNKTDENAEPSEIFIIPSHKIEPIPDEQMWIKGYAYDPGNGKKIPLEEWEVVHYKQFNPFNPYVGMSPIEALATTAVGDLKMQEWNTNFFGKNNAKMPGVLAFSDPIPDTDWDKMKADVKDQHGGTKRSLMMLRNVGEGGVNWVATAMSQNEMQFLEGREFNKKEIYDVFAPGLYSWTSENATEANARAGRDAYFELAVWPMHTSVQETITNKIMPLYGENLRTEFENVRPKRVEEKHKEIELYSRFHTDNEVRQRYFSSEPIEGGDVLFKPQRTAMVAEKEDERRKFMKYAQKRLDEGKPEKVDEFVFEYLDEGEQAAVKADLIDEDPRVKLVKEAIDELRSRA